uniref:Metalloendopeptidase n=1 Tax=Latimeria chalumnae TaxID=7897 RepID=H3AEQ5_LATCH
GSRKLLYDGDIPVNTRRSALSCPGNSCLWPKSSDGFIKIPLQLSNDYSANEKSFLLSSIREFETLTCVRFLNRTNENDYVSIVSRDGCWSHIGKVGGKQHLSLVKGCLEKGVAQHELNHVLGFLHEQCRSDRDNYILIRWRYINPAYIRNFVVKPTNTLGLPYDYSSVMHYGKYAYSIVSGQPTIVPIPDVTVPLGQKEGLSSLDVRKINKLYDCNTCSTLLTDQIGNVSSAENPSLYTNNSSCVWLIRTPGIKVYLEFLTFDVQNSSDCSKNYIKVYDGNTRASRVLLEKSCRNVQLPLLISTGNLILIELVSDGSIGTAGFTASYKTVSCGGTLTTKTGNISSPNYPYEYPANIECTWIIVAPIRHEVSLHVTSFEVEEAPDCQSDHFLIRDGGNVGSPLKGRYCGQMNIPSLRSTGNSVMLQFYSDESIQLSGFLASYTISKSL